MLDIRPARLDEPAVLALVDEVQAYYVTLYGGPDEDPLRPEEFAPPRGGFLLGLEDGAPVAMGGWSHLEGSPGDVKLRRMFVRAGAQRRGYASVLLAALEEQAARSGATRVVLTTGSPQVDAIAFYRARGYDDVAPFGYYADQPAAVHLGRRL